MSTRKKQTKNKKKNRKAQRREDTTGSNSLFDTSELGEALPSTEGPKASRPTEANQVTVPEGSAEPRTDSRKSCNTCGGSFEAAAAYRAHFRSDWHRFNQKLSLSGATPISEQEFKLVDAESFFKGISDDSIL